MAAVNPTATRPTATLPATISRGDTSTIATPVVVSVQSQMAISMAAQIVKVNAAIASAGTLQTASLSQLQPAVDVIDNAVAVFDANAALLDGMIDEVDAGGVDPDQPAVLNVAALIEQASIVSQLAIVIEGGNYMARAAVNLQQATG